MIQVSFEGVPELTKRLGKVADWVNDGIAGTLEDAGKRFIEQLPPDPPPSGKSMLPFIKSPKQFRWLMWAINSGEITVPYPRTGEMRRSIIAEVKRLGGEIVGYIVARAPQALYVIDEQNQSRYHKGNWWTLQGELRKGTRVIMNVIAAALKRAVNGN